jgi:hypothetical protein
MIRVVGARQHHHALGKYYRGDTQRLTPNAPMERAWRVPSTEGRLAAVAYLAGEPSSAAVWLGPIPPPAQPLNRATARSSIVEL